MEPLDTDLEYMTSQSRPDTPRSRLNALFIFPIIGLILVLVFIAAAIFKLRLSDLVDTLVGVMLVLFAALIAMLFWALSPRGEKA